MENPQLKQQKEKLNLKQQKRKEQKEKKEAKAYINVKSKDVAKPYHEKYLLLFYLAVVGSFLANILSGVTESSKIFAFWWGLFKEFMFASELTWIMVIIGVLFIEGANRFIGKSYFEDYAENDGHHSDMNGRLAGMVILSVFSIFLSFGGSFDLVELTRTPPTLATPSLMTKDGIDKTYNKLIAEAGHDAKEYRKSRTWKERLSKKDTKRYNELVDKKQKLITEHSAAIVNLSKENTAEKEAIKKENESLMATHNSAIENKGYGLGFLTIVAILGLYVCLWYSAKYQEEKKDYLEEKFKDYFDSTDDQDSPDKTDDKYQLLENQIKSLEAKLIAPTHPNNFVPPNGQYFHNNFVAPPNYYQNPVAPNQSTSAVRIQGFLGRSNDPTQPNRPEIHNEDVPQCATTSHNEASTHTNTVNTKLVDIKSLERDISTYYTRSFTIKEVGNNGSKYPETRQANKQRVLEAMEELKQNGKGTIINFDKYERIKFYELTQEIA